MVFSGPSEYLVLKARANALPVIAVTRPDYYTVFLVRADSEVNVFIGEQVLWLFLIGEVQLILGRGSLLDMVVLIGLVVVEVVDLEVLVWVFNSRHEVGFEILNHILDVVVPNLNVG